MVVRTLTSPHALYRRADARRRETTGFKLHARDLSNLTLTLGAHTNAGVPLGVSVDYAPFAPVAVGPGANVIPLVGKRDGATSVVRVRAEVYNNERFQLLSLVTNKVCMFRVV